MEDTQGVCALAGPSLPFYHLTNHPGCTGEETEAQSHNRLRPDPSHTPCLHHSVFSVWAVMGVRGLGAVREGTSDWSPCPSKHLEAQASGST